MNTTERAQCRRISFCCWSLTKTIPKQRVFGQTACADTRGLLQRAHIIANWRPIYIAKESDKRWEEGEDLSLLEFKTIEYKRKGYAIATNEQLKRIAKIPKREFMRCGIFQHTVEKIGARVPVRAIMLASSKVLAEYQLFESTATIGLLP